MALTNETTECNNCGITVEVPIGHDPDETTCIRCEREA